MFNQQLKRNLFLSILVMLPGLWAGLMAQTAVTIKPLFNQEKAATIYEVKFTVREALAADAEFELIFPGSYNLTKVTLAGSADINGGFQTSVKDSTVTLKRSGLGKIVPTGSVVTLQLATIVNPGKAGEYPVRFQVKSSRGDAAIATAVPVQIAKTTDEN
ncbi:hypothetical protein L0128_04210 [candidate division KSB1 bacterium]|nr:hypothetical protein [candidate division KSB1 bacterium]